MDEEIKILCVDDEPNVLNALKRLFLDDKYTIFTAASGQEGISILEKEHVQLVISDYRMPSMSGVEFLREVYKRWPATVRIVLSGYADASAIVGAINEGHIYKFIPKPWNDDELKIAISNAIERYTLYRRNTELTAELQNKNDELINLNEQLKTLLDTQSKSLEFRSRSLSTHQELLDAMPVGILGVDNADMVVMCNVSCLRFFNKTDSIIGRDARSVVSEEVLQFIDTVKSSACTTGWYMQGRFRLRMIGAAVEEKGVIVIFVAENDSA